MGKCFLSASWLSSIGFAPGVHRSDYPGLEPIELPYWIKTVEAEPHPEGVSWTRIICHGPPSVGGRWDIEVSQGIGDREQNRIAVLLGRDQTRDDILRLISVIEVPEVG